MQPKDLARVLCASIAASSMLFFLSVLTVRYADARILAGLWGGAGLLVLVLNEIVFRGFAQKSLGVWKASALFALLYPALLAHDAAGYAVFALFALAFGLAQGIVCRLEGVKASALAVLIYIGFFFLAGETYIASFALALFLFSAPVYLSLEKSRSVWEALEKLGLSKKNLVANVVFGVALVGFVFFLLAVLGLASNALGVNDQAKVALKIMEASPIVLFCAVAVSPLAEEVFFRGFLAKRFGVVASSVLFALAHVGYGSVVEVAAALVIGLVFAKAFLQTRSLVAPVVAHYALNAVAAAVFLYTRGA